jgi:hypothetical protein
MGMDRHLLEETAIDLYRRRLLQIGIGDRQRPRGLQRGIGSKIVVTQIISDDLIAQRKPSICKDRDVKEQDLSLHASEPFFF